MRVVIKVSDLPLLHLSQLTRSCLAVCAPLYFWHISVIHLILPKQVPHRHKQKSFLLTVLPKDMTHC